MQADYGKINLLELILTSMKNGSQYPYQLSYLAGTLARIINPTEKRAISYTDEQVGPTVIADLKDLYNSISQGKPWRGIDPVIAISNPTNEGVTGIVLDSARDELIKTYPLIGSTLGSLNDPFGSKDECIIIGGFKVEDLLKKLRISINPGLKINYDIPNGFISRALYDLSEMAVADIGRLNEQYGKYFYVARSTSEGFKVNTNLYWSSESIPNEVVKREFTFNCISTKPEFGGAPFEVKAQVIDGEKLPKIININTNKVTGFSNGRTWAMQKLFSLHDENFTNQFSNAVKEANESGFSVMLFSDENGLEHQLNFAQVDDDTVVEDTVQAPDDATDEVKEQCANYSQLTRVYADPANPGNLKVAPITTTQGDGVKDDDIAGRVNDVANPDHQATKDQGIDNSGKMEKKFSEGDCPSVAKGGSAKPEKAAGNETATPGGAPMTEQVALNNEVGLIEKQANKSYIITDGNQMTFSYDGDFRSAFAIASRMGAVRVFSADELHLSPNTKPQGNGVNDDDIAGRVDDVANPAHQATKDQGIDNSGKIEKKFSDEDAETLAGAANELQAKVDDLKAAAKDNPDSDAVKAKAQEVKEDADLVASAAQDAEDAGINVDDVKEKCATYSYIASAIIANRTFSDPDDEVPTKNDVIKATNELQDKVDDLKEIASDPDKKDEAKAKADDVKADAEAVAKVAQNLSDAGEDMSEVTKKCSYFSYVAACVVANRTFSDDDNPEKLDEEADKKTEEAAKAQKEADKAKDTADKKQQKADDKVNEAADKSAEANDAKKKDEAKKDENDNDNGNDDKEKDFSTMHSDLFSGTPMAGEDLNVAAQQVAAQPTATPAQATPTPQVQTQAQPAVDPTSQPAAQPSQVPVVDPNTQPAQPVQQGQQQFSQRTFSDLGNIGVSNPYLMTEF